MDNLGAHIRELRIEKGLTQLEVAEALNVTPGYISNVENNRVAMSLKLLIQFARLTGTTLDSLVGEIFPEYRMTALDNEILAFLSKKDESFKAKLLNTLKLWWPVS
ncbi:MAG: helix-turn-helix domain-containing protein [Lachnospiraceae bacterium]|nr:helix-turn-helix domain-containing protein [Lachnospiraceae bacterium]